MGGGAADEAAAVVGVLADLATGATNGRRPALSVPLEWFRWVPMCEHMFRPSVVPLDPQDILSVLASGSHRESIPSIRIEAGYGERLAGLGQVRTTQHPVRLGWLFVAGSTEEGGRTRRVFHPLVSIAARVVKPPLASSAYVVPVGDARVSHLVPRADQRRLEDGLEFGGGAFSSTTGVAASPKLLARLPKLQRFAMEAARSAGLPADRVVPVAGSPDDLMEQPGLTVVAGYGLYVVGDGDGATAPSALRAWASVDLSRPTAFHAVYGLGQPAAGTDGTTPPEGPLVLSPSQRDAVRRSRVEPVTVISGPPGTGKSHTVAAVACDAVARGARVLVASKSAAGVDALVQLLERVPGPDPVVFGSHARRSDLAARLAAGQRSPVPQAIVDGAAATRDRVTAERDAVRRSILTDLDAEASWARAHDDVDDAWHVAPGMLDPLVDVARVEELVAAATGTGRGWWGRRRRRRALAELLTLGRCPTGTTIDALEPAIALVRSRAAARRLDAAGGLDLTARWEHLERVDAAARDAIGAWLAADARSPARIHSGTLSAIGGLATALRSGRSARREQLARLDAAALTAGFPLWIGTLDDIDDLLPARLASFDLVVLDEASSIDQASAAPALLRASRAVVVGDPRQLRHVSFVGDAAITSSLERNGLDGAAVAAKLDVRRNSIFDTAAAIAPVTVLDEHYRSDPHLVDFVVRRIYDGSITIATHSPATDHRDCVDAIRVDGTADPQGVVRAEIDRALVEVRRAAARGVRSIGLISPFRNQADALERAVLASFSAAELEAVDARIGTVHAFQGNERDLVICSLGIAPDSSAATWRFAQDPHLLAVFLTRARKQFVFIYSGDPPPDGTLAAYLAQSDSPPGAGTVDRPPRDWAARVREELAGADLRVALDYPTGRHVLDAVLLDAPQPTALVVGVHPDGPEAHVDRHLALRRQGWTVIEVFESAWSEQLAVLAVGLRTGA